MTHLIVDHTHLGRHVTGIERVALELFTPDRIAPHTVSTVVVPQSPGPVAVARMVFAQQLAFWRAGRADTGAWVMFPGFPPMPLSCRLGDRCLMYVHDLFPITRPGEVGWKARAYTAPALRWALARVRHIFVNSQTTGQDVRRAARPDAIIAPLRPPVRDVFGLSGHPTGAAPAPRPLRLLSIGTVEPRKNLPAAIAITAALNAGGRAAELHIAGRIGWGNHPWTAAPPPFVKLHGYVSDNVMRSLVAASDLLLCTSRAEGLGLPLLEVQHGGLPVVAPRGAVFEEVLGASGTFIDVGEPQLAAQAIVQAPFGPAARAAARANVARWNVLSTRDGERFRQFLSERRAADAPLAAGMTPA